MVALFPTSKLLPAKKEGRPSLRYFLTLSEDIVHHDMSRSGNIGKWYVHAFAMPPTLRFESHSLIFYLFCVELDEIQMP